MIRAIAIHLPQFHPIPENDSWWGKGFTEWTNVAKARPRFSGHYQPHLPADLGFYDLRLEETRIAQAQMARQYGIYGFCYYHYWFNGKRLLNRPLDDMLANRNPDFPFMYCWANENWTRRWDGNNEKYLIKQEYSAADDLAHIRFLCEKVFSDPRYIRINGKPFFVIYRPRLLPDIQNTLEAWRNEAQKMGIGDLYLGYMQGFQVKDAPERMGFDVAIDFQPDFYNTVPVYRGSTFDILLDKLKIKSSVFSRNRIIDYREYVDSIKQVPFPAYKLFPSLTPRWDNTPRRKNDAFIFKNDSPEIYEDWLRHIYKNFRPYSEEENFVFINAWNEWAEGNHLEPCVKWGTKYLEATQKVISNEK